MRKPVNTQEAAAETEAPATAAAAPSTSPAKKAKRTLAGKVRVLDTQLDYPFGTTRRPGDVIENMDEESVRHFIALGAVELVD